MSLHYRRQGAAIIIFGNTYAYKDQIKSMGGRFNGADKNWRIPFSDDNAASIGALCAAAGGGALADLGTESGAESTIQVERSGPLERSTTVQVIQSSDSFSLARIETQNFQGATVTKSGAFAKGVSQADESTESQLGPPADGLSIRQLMDRLGSAVGSVFPGGVWVIGEVQNLATRSSGIFLDLAEPSIGAHQNATTTVRAMLWNASLAGIKMRRGADLLADILQDGLKIRCFCQVSLYKDRGSISLTIDDIDPAFTKGTLALAREKLLKELRAKGLDRANKKLVLPAFPLRIGLISAESSRAKSDFLDQLNQGGFPGEVLFRHSPMQGEAVPQQVAKMLSELSNEACDLIVITRGGGSAADLRWFDAPEIAYAIAGCPVPVIAAIGHHDDVCIAEEICHLRQKTPTAAADFVLSCFVETKRRIEALAETFARLLGQRVDEVITLQAMLSERLSSTAVLTLARRKERLAEQNARLTRTAEARLASQGETLLRQKNRLLVTAMGALSHLEKTLSQWERLIVQRDPSPWLKQGWTQLRGPRGLVRNLGDTAVGDSLVIRLGDGTVSALVQELKPSPVTVT